MLVTGGSLGAARINDATLDLVRLWAARADLAVRHVVGPRNIDSVRARAPSLPAGGLQYEIVAYEDDMPTAMAAADVVVCRASSGLVSEVAVIGVPSVLVPWSGAAEDHQTANASVLLDVGAAEVITDAEVSGARLQSALESLLADPARLDSMARACKEVARPDAAQRVADLVEEQRAWLTDRRSTSPARRCAVHIIGIGGAGMSAIATVLAAMGHRVSGSDLKGSAFLDRLRALGVDVRVGHDAANVGDVDVVAVSTAIPPTNPEVVAARERGIPVLRRAEILTAIVATKRGVAVGGTHGKTTTSSMLALVLVEAGLHPSFIVGGELNEIGTGAVWDGRGDLLVVEADESDGTFIELPAEAVLVTNVEPDHIEHYGTFDALRAAFARFLDQAPGPLVSSASTTRSRPSSALHAARSGYGIDEAADYRMVDVTTGHGGVRFTLARRDGSAWPVSLPDPRSPQRAQRRRSDGDGDRARGGARGGGAGARTVRRGRPPVRAPRERRRRDLRRRVLASAERGRRGDRSCERRVTGNASCASSSLIASAAPPRSGRTSKTRSSARMCSPSPTCTRPARHHGRGSQGS